MDGWMDGFHGFWGLGSVLHIVGRNRCDGGYFCFVFCFLYLFFVLSFISFYIFCEGLLLMLF